METTGHRVTISDSVGDVSAVLSRPDDAFCLYVYAHGAGAGMRHRFMEATSDGLVARGVATLRFDFPYMEAGRRAPDRAARLIETVRALVSEAGRLAPELPLLAGGKSMGGRMTSTAASEAPLPGVRGLAFFGFPLHAPGRDSSQRGAHLADVGLPMLFLQGTRDKLANLELLRPLLADVRPVPTLHVVEGADHGFHVLKRSGRTDDEVLEELCGTFAAWARKVTAG
jgi:predicted alpha/beta-hydrolase family hydrolase